MGNTELQVWLRDAMGIDVDEIPESLYPAFQTLRNRVNQSERKIQALLKQKQLFTLLVNGTVDMFVMFSAKDCRVDYVSPNMEFLLGLSIEEIREDLGLLYQTSPKMARPSMEELMEIPLGESMEFLDEHTHLKTGEYRWYRKTVYHFFLNNDHKFIMVMSDRTTEMDMHKQLEIAIEMTKSANEAKSSFLANMSHDIRTPMNAIVGFSKLLKHDAEKPAKVRDYAKKISSSSHHLLSLINDILDMSKIESGKATLNIDEFNLSDLLDEVSIVVNERAKAKNQEFRMKTQGIVNDKVRGDKTRIHQVLLNLLSNSVKYTPEGGKIQLILIQEGPADGRYANLQLQVIDNGMGMSPEYLKVIFDAFSREETEATREIQGTGLGMAITKNLVELMGGTISVESEKNKGTTFTVDLKLPAVAMDTDREFWKNNEIQKILVVYGDEDVCKDIKKVMSKTGVVVAHTCSEEDAVRFVIGAADVKQQYDLVLIDWNMPNKNGVEIVRSIRDVLKDQMPPVLMSAYDWSDIEDDAIEVGVAGFMPKPFFISNFRSAILKLKNLEDEKEEESDISISGLRFLAAEDNALNAEILMELLELEGASCEIAENGKIAVEMFQSSSPGYYDMILMDVQMPVMDGHAAARAIRSCDHHDALSIPIAAMTANAFQEDARQALHAGMNAHISKPVDMNLLKETVRGLVKK